ncbi:MAG: hypothetical protein S4CHLAM20_14980 [Chlamydiia bacterium]|nr:hypothetical protein [Chlamydiia bacterium]
MDAARPTNPSASQTYAETKQELPTTQSTSRSSVITHINSSNRPGWLSQNIEECFDRATRWINQCSSFLEVDPTKLLKDLHTKLIETNYKTQNDDYLAEYISNRFDLIFAIFSTRLVVLFSQTSKNFMDLNPESPEPRQCQEVLELSRQFNMKTNSPSKPIIGSKEDFVRKELIRHIIDYKDNAETRSNSEDTGIYPPCYPNYRRSIVNDLIDQFENPNARIREKVITALNNSGEKKLAARLSGTSIRPDWLNKSINRKINRLVDFVTQLSTHLEINQDVVSKLIKEIRSRFSETNYCVDGEFFKDLTDIQLNSIYVIFYNRLLIASIDADPNKVKSFKITKQYPSCFSDFTKTLSKYQESYNSTKTGLDKTNYVIVKRVNPIARKKGPFDPKDVWLNSFEVIQDLLNQCTDSPVEKKSLVMQKIRRNGRAAMANRLDAYFTDRKKTLAKKEHSTTTTNHAFQPPESDARIKDETESKITDTSTVRPHRIEARIKRRSEEMNTYLTELFTHLKKDPRTICAEFEELLSNANYCMPDGSYNDKYVDHQLNVIDMILKTRLLVILSQEKTDLATFKSATLYSEKFNDLIDLSEAMKKKISNSRKPSIMSIEDFVRIELLNKIADAKAPYNIDDEFSNSFEVASDLINQLDQPQYKYQDDFVEKIMNSGRKLMALQLSEAWNLITLINPKKGNGAVIYETRPRKSAQTEIAQLIAARYA